MKRDAPWPDWTRFSNTGRHLSIRWSSSRVPVRSSCFKRCSAMNSPAHWRLWIRHGHPQVLTPSITLESHLGTSIRDSVVKR